MNATRPTYLDMDVPCPSCRESIDVRVAAYPGDKENRGEYYITSSTKCPECRVAYEAGELEGYLDRDAVDAALQAHHARTTYTPEDEY